MTALAPPMASPNTLKRAYSEVDFDDGPLDSQRSSSQARQGITQPSAPSNTSHGDYRLPPSTPGRSRANSPARNPPGSTAGDVPSALRSTPTAPTESAPKKRKLTFAEKETKRIEKEAKDRHKAEEKARKELEKQEKELERRRKEEETKEEKRRKEEERDEKRRAKEAEKQLKEEEKKQKEVEKKAKEDEKHKKDKVSMPLAHFSEASIMS